jgi:hypothetical protein
MDIKSNFSSKNTPMNTEVLPLHFHATVILESNLLKMGAKLGVLPLFNLVCGISLPVDRPTISFSSWLAKFKHVLQQTTNKLCWCRSLSSFESSNCLLSPFPTLPAYYKYISKALFLLAYIFNVPSGLHSKAADKNFV